MLNIICSARAPRRVTLSNYFTNLFGGCLQWPWFLAAVVDPQRDLEERQRFLRKLFEDDESQLDFAMSLKLRKMYEHRQYEFDEVARPLRVWAPCCHTLRP